MIHELATRLSYAFLAFQGGPAPPPGMTDAEFEKFMSLMPIYLIVGLIALVVGIWMVIDAWNNYGAGWGILSCVGCLFFSWIAIIIYLIVRFAAAPPDKMRYSERSSSAGSYSPPPVYGGGARPAPQDIELAPQEHDERIDEMLAQGKGREAMDYAQQMFKMAQDFKDTSGQARYRKYIERIRMGIK